MRKKVFIIVIASMLVLSACGKEETVAEPQVEIEETVEKETEPEVVEETAEEETEPEIVEETAEEETEPEVVEETAEEETEPEVVEETAEEETEPEIVEETAEEQAKEEAPTDNSSTGTDASVPVTKEVAQEQQAQQTVEQPQPTPEVTTPTPQEELVDGMTLEERQAMADKANERTAKITDPNDPEYGVTYSVGKVHGSFR